MGEDCKEETDQEEDTNGERVVLEDVSQAGEASLAGRSSGNR